MSAGTTIEWTDATWNPTRGCTRVSEGCRHCYAERVAARFSGPGQPYHGVAHHVNGDARWTGDVRVAPARILAQPIHWRKPRRVFVDSMSDLFHEAVPFPVVAAIFAVMAYCARHAFQVLTKRPERARAFFRWLDDDAQGGGAYGGGSLPRSLAADDAIAQQLHNHDKKLYLDGCLYNDGVWPPRNVWLGVSVEDQATAEERIPVLLDTPAAVRWVSYEPALGPVDFSTWLPDAGADQDTTAYAAHLGGVGAGPKTGLDWIVVGGESGPGARPFDVAWARATIAAGRAAGVPVFVKQLGARPVDRAAPVIPAARDSILDGLHHTKGGDPAEWPEDLVVREYPAAAAAETARA